MFGTTQTTETAKNEETTQQIQPDTNLEEKKCTRHKSEVGK